MRSQVARHDGHAEWYDETFSAFLNEEEVTFLRESLGPGDGEICLCRADARRLPVQDASVAVAAGMFFHTDVEDFVAVARDVARCLHTGGRFVYLGVHPCFVGPFVNRMTECENLRLSFTVGYGNTGWANRGSGDGSMIGGRVGFHHKTLASFIDAFTSAGLSIRVVREFSADGHVVADE